MKIKGNNQLLKIFSAKSLTQGLTLIELLIALFLSGIIFTAAAGGLMSVLSTNRELEAKGNRKDELTRALNYMKREINEASYIQREVPGTSSDRLCKTSGVDGDCLRLIYLHPDSDVVGDTNAGDGDMDCIEKIIYYAFEDISGGSQTWLKPARLRRKEVRPIHSETTPPLNVNPSRLESCDGHELARDADEVADIPETNLTTNNWESRSGDTPSWQVLADGILGDNEHNPNPTCESGWDGPYGQNADDKGGFRFCLRNTTDTNRGVQIFLYGYVLSKDIGDTIEVNSISYALNPLEHEL